MTDRPPRVVILGGGFAGLYAAKRLRRAPVRVTVVDRRNHHLFQPLLYQVATAGLSAPDVAEPIRRILRRQQNAEVLLAEARGVDLDRRRVALAGGGEIDYDYLIVATGAAHSYFGNDAWAGHAPGLKNVEDALEIRRRILLAFERAELASDDEERREWLTFAVIGAGPTGVEMAGALAEIARHTLVRDFRHFDPRAARVVLLEAMDRILPPFPPDVSQKARRQLEELEVEVRTSAPVTAVDDRGLEAGGERISARTVIWAAGVAASPLGRSLGAATDKAGRVAVERDLTVAGHPEVFVVGDLAYLEQDGKAVFGMAPGAIQGGEHAASNVLRAIRGEPLAPFRFRDRGAMVAIGRRTAVAVIKGRHLSGALAWLVWLAVHIFFLIGFRNRFVVMFDWAWAYLTYQSSARLILHGVRGTTAEERGAEGPPAL